MGFVLQVEPHEFIECDNGFAQIRGTTTFISPLNHSGDNSFPSISFQNSPPDGGWCPQSHRVCSAPAEQFFWRLEWWHPCQKEPPSREFRHKTHPFHPI